VKEDLDRILQDATLVTIAFAIAIGWSLYQLAHAVAFFIDGLTVHLPSSSPNGLIPYSTQSGGLTWVIGRHIVALDGIVIGVIELGAVLLVAVAVRRRVRPN
jgi:hypothetical protein